MMNFIGTVENMDLDHPPKSIDFMLHGGFLSAGGVYLIVITWLLEKANYCWLIDRGRLAGFGTPLNF